LIRRIAFAYAWLLFSAEVVLLSCSLSLHIGVLLGFDTPYLKVENVLNIAMMALFIPTCAFVKNSLRWVQQIKTCPDWMWRTALLTGGYGLFVFLLQMFVFPNEGNLEDQTLATSGFILGFEAIPACILYSLLRSEQIEASELMRRSRNSVLIVVACSLWLLIRRAIH
jgi:hypothetical protein